MCDLDAAQPDGVRLELFEADPEFWSRVVVGGPDECWLFTGRKDDDGYGVFKGRRAHRYALSLHTNGIPDGLNALHSCHVRNCCNPAHLRWGDQQMNAMDRVAAGRMPKIVRKLDRDDVIIMRRIGSNGVHYKQIARWFGITPHHCRSVLNYNKWASIQIGT